MSMVEKINEGIKKAMRDRDQIRLGTLRMLKSKILAVDARANLPDEEVVKLFKTYYSNLKEAYLQAQEGHRMEIAEQLKSELSIVQEFLPKVPSIEETRGIIEEAIQKSGAKSKKDLRQVMKSAMELNSAIDGKLAKELAIEMLSD